MKRIIALTLCGVMSLSLMTSQTFAGVVYESAELDEFTTVTTTSEYEMACQASAEFKKTQSVGTDPLVEYESAFAQLSSSTSSQDPFSVDSIQSEASSLLDLAFRQGIVPGQDSCKITSLYLSNSIPVYEVTTDNAIAEVSRIKYYSVLDQNGVSRGIIIARMQHNDTTVTCEYNTLFCDELTAYKRNSSEICFLFDKTDIYIYDGVGFCTVLQDDAMPDASRGTLNTKSTRTAQINQLQRNEISIATELNLSSPMNIRASTEGSLNVPKVSQTGWNNGCWAACSISVGRYLNPSITLNIADIMDEYADGNDVAKSIFTVQDVLAYEYGIETNQHLLGSLSMGTVMENIGVGKDNGNPIIARVTYSGVSSGHFIVVRGYTYASTTGTSNRATIMDPLSTSAYRILTTSGTGENATFQYTSVSGSNSYDVGMYLTIS